MCHIWRGRTLTLTYSSICLLIDSFLIIYLFIVYLFLYSMQCDTLIEQHEETIDNWFFKTDQEKPLSEYLCRERALTKEETGEKNRKYTSQIFVRY